RTGGRELRGVVHRPDGERNRGLCAEAGGVGGAVDEAVGAVVVRDGGVGEVPVGVEVQRAVGRAAHQRGGQAAVGAAVVAQHPVSVGVVRGEGLVLVQVVGVGLRHRVRIVFNGEGVRAADG